MGIQDIIKSIESADIIPQLLIKIKKMEIQKDLFSHTTETITHQEIKLLIEIANILAASPEIEHKKEALHIATSLPLITEFKGVQLTSLMILRKLENFPAIHLLEEKRNISEYRNGLSGLSLFEAYFQESLNTRNFFGKDFVLTKFQKKVSNLVSEFKNLSISAPTSAGKSFIFLKVILNLIYEEKGATAIYIVPTRALIRQVMNDFLENIKQFNLEDIYIGCSSEISSLLGRTGKSNILVLTQERLYQLCTKENVKSLNTKIIVVDEAHNIESGGRGVLLEGALKYAQILWPQVRLLFSSPLVSNPEKLLSTFKLEDSCPEKDLFPLVRQNIIEVQRTSKKLIVSSDFKKNKFEIARIPYVNNGSSKAKILANVVIELWNEQTSIIYASEPMLSSNVARELFNSGKFPQLNDERLDEFADFIEEYISEKYELSKFIRCGIAFHFSALPPIVRAGIEDLFKCGALKIISCTSTLLEGINMPAKNIFTYKPNKGKNTPIDRLNFWNLVGRAGRMGTDFAGNIICIDPNKWDENPLVGEVLQQVIPASEKKLVDKDESEKLKEYIANRDKPSGIDDYNEQLASMIIREKIRGEQLVNSIYKSQENIQVLKEIDEITETILNEFTAPIELLELNPGIDPDRINDLWKFFMQNEELYKQLIPRFPYEEEGYQRLRLMIKIIKKVFLFNEDWSEKFIEKITAVSHNWMIGAPLSKIIFYNKTVLQKEPKKITSYVKQQIDFLNTTIRYKLVKYSQVYTEVLKVFLDRIGKKEEAKKVVNISVYLEYGACSAPALEFMAIGLPREAAVKLEKLINKKQNATSEYYLKWLKNLDLDALKISSYLKKQIKNVRETL
ncbi:DEAD/DEAH box helicase [Bacillus thuringiensis]|uniref:DEAD/DEAH box helicase n=1 Tax=Bacillus thuringiensis TaxID=1428 RepID=UPI000BFD26E8|nr:DEAD/DEAH box helicase [Bacillus thuringiensis]PGH96186.1 DEAD/DEAH box helicase [Bacillus thuringiensis]